jgi:RES domain-containing protein
MTPVPGPLGGSELLAWRLDKAVHAANWTSGEGAYRVGGRWNSRGVRAVYCGVDPATAILEVAAHTGFRTLDTVAHVLTAIEVVAPADVHIVDPATLPNPNWLLPGLISAGQQAFGDALLAGHKFILVPSVVSRHSWNLVFVAATAVGAYAQRSQEPFALDPRLHPAAPAC